MKYLILLLFTNVCLAASSGGLNLHGSIPPELSINVQNIVGNLSLDVANGETNKYVGLVEEVSNLQNGYRILLSSANAGKLVCETDSSQFTGYFVSYDGDIFKQPTPIPEVYKSVLTQVIKITDYSEVNVNVVANPDGLACVYKDQITIQIEAN